LAVPRRRGAERGASQERGVLAMPDTPTAGQQAVNALKLVADVGILPCTSQFVEGKVGSGILYVLAGLAAKAVLTRPIGFLAGVGVGLDSFAKSPSGRHLWELPRSEARTPAPSAPATPQMP